MPLATPSLFRPLRGFEGRKNPALHKHMVLALPVSAALVHAAAFGQVLHFEHATDTIQVPLHTSLSTQATFEARIKIPIGGTPDGTIYHEERSGLQDKALGCYDNIAYGWAWTRNYDNLPAAAESPPITDGLWHHIAFVRDDTEERFYLDGTLVSTAAWTEQIGNWLTGTPMTLGASHFFYNTDAPLIWVDWLHISRIARYSGQFSPPPACEPVSDSNTLALFLFDDAPGSTTAFDSGPQAAHGTLGFGFTGATSPVFESNPSQNGQPSFAQPASAAVCASGSATLSVAPVGAGAFTYQWQALSSGAWTNISDGPLVDLAGVILADISDSSTRTVRITVHRDYANTSEWHQWRCIVTNSCGVVPSDPATLSLCNADFNCDGIVDFFDYLDFVDAFSSNAANADFNNDGIIDFFDYLDFVDAFSTGC